MYIINNGGHSLQNILHKEQSCITCSTVIYSITTLYYHTVLICSATFSTGVLYKFPSDWSCLIFGWYVMPCSYLIRCLTCVLSTWIFDVTILLTVPIVNYDVNNSSSCLIQDFFKTTQVNKYMKIRIWNYVHKILNSMVNILSECMERY
jgi:hypothetical protein